MDSRILMTDCTLQQAEKRENLSFRDKIELCKLIDRLNVNTIQLNPIVNRKLDSLLLKSVSSACRNAGLCVAVGLDAESVAVTWNALRNAAGARLQISVPVSSVQMEYLFHKKPAQLKDAVLKTIGECKAYTNSIELIAEDATRSDPAFLTELFSAAAESGVKYITICDTAGILFPDETYSFISTLYKQVPLLKNICVGYSCSSQMNLADANAVAAIKAGVRELKTVSNGGDGISLKNIVRILGSKRFEEHFVTNVFAEQISRITGQIQSICELPDEHRTAAGSGLFTAESSDTPLNAFDTKETIQKTAERLGYDLNPEDLEKVWKRFTEVSQRKETITMREFEAVIASEAMQVPPAYKDFNYVINTGNTIGAMSRMKMKFHDQEIEGISAGDGAIDAAFRSVEQAIGRHFELDDFQIQAIAEGREAMGETIVKLRSDGKLYSGRGISTDIVGASIMAYMNAVNKIIFEEEEEV